jgi:hypothetical protein
MAGNGGFPPVNRGGAISAYQNRVHGIMLDMIFQRGKKNTTKILPLETKISPMIVDHESLLSAIVLSPYGDLCDLDSRDGLAHVPMMNFG